MAFNRCEGQNKYFGSSYNSEGYGYYHSKKNGKRSYYGNNTEYNSYNKEQRHYSNWNYKQKYSGFGAYHEKYAYSEADETKENIFASADTISQTSSKSTEQSHNMNSISGNSDAECKTNVNKDSNKEGKLCFENPYQIINSKYKSRLQEELKALIIHTKTNNRKESINSDISINTQNTECDVESVKNKKENIPLIEEKQCSEFPECRKQENSIKQNPYPPTKLSNTNSEWKQGKFHNCSIFCIKNCSTWRLKIRKTQNPFNNINKKFDVNEKEMYCKTYILSKKVAIRSQELNLDFMQDLQDADNLCSIDSPIELDTGFDKEKFNLSKIEGIDYENTVNSSILLDALLPIKNENRSAEFLHLNSNHDKKDNLICVEFEIDPEKEEFEFLRDLNQTMVESHVQFKLNGRVHTK